VFQVHGMDRHGKVVLRKRLRRVQVLAFFANLPPCLIGLEACGGALYWARALSGLGHEARLMPPQYVKPYLKTNKHDAADAEACCARSSAPTTESAVGARRGCSGRACGSRRSRANGNRRR
jgi:transposase